MIYFEREREREQASGGWGRREGKRERERERERIPSRFCAVNAEPDTGLELSSHEIVS